MRSPRALLVGTLCAFAVGTAILCLGKRPTPAPQVGIGLRGYESESGRIIGVMEITNLGSDWVSLSMTEPLRSPSGCCVRAFASLGETNYPVRGTNEFTVAYRPGESTSIWVPLPSDTVRWSVAFRVRNATKSEQSYWATFGSRRWRLCFEHPWIFKLLPNKPAPQREIQSEIFDIPRDAHNPRSALDAGLRLCLHIGDHWPGASESER